MTRAVLYHRISLADAGESLEVGLERCRRHAALKGARVVAELTDDRPRPHLARDGWNALRRLLARDGADLVVATDLYRLLPDLRRGVKEWARWLELGIDLVAIDDAIDTTMAEQRDRFAAVLQVLATFEGRRHSEATRAGMLAHAAGIGGRRRVAVDPLEVAELWARGLSLRQMVRDMKRRGAKISYGTLWKHLNRLREEGALDRERRAEALRVKPLDRGGRPRTRAAA